jgi:hypothetical protein
MQTVRLLHPWLAVLAVLAAGPAPCGAEPAGAVTGLQVTPVTLSQLDLHWAPVEKAERYNVYQSTSKGFVPSDDNWVGSTSVNSYCSRDLVPATTYYFQVRSIVGGKEGRRAEACGTTRHKDLALVAMGSRRIVEGDAFQIAWDANRGGEIVEIQ